MRGHHNHHQQATPKAPTARQGHPTTSTTGRRQRPQRGCRSRPRSSCQESPPRRRATQRAAAQVAQGRRLHPPRDERVESPDRRQARLPLELDFSSPEFSSRRPTSSSMPPTSSKSTPPPHKSALSPLTPPPPPEKKKNQDRLHVQFVSRNCPDAFQHLNKLKRLVIDRNALCDVQFKGLSSLITLSLADNRLNYLNDMSDLKKLIYLNLAGNKLTGALPDLPPLQREQHTSSKLSYLSGKEMGERREGKGKETTQLTKSDVLMGLIIAAGFDQIAKCKGLRVLDLGNNNIDFSIGQFYRSFKFLKTLPKLHWLSFEGNPCESRRSLILGTLSISILSTIAAAAKPQYSP